MKTDEQKNVLSKFMILCWPHSQPSWAACGLWAVGWMLLWRNTHSLKQKPYFKTTTQQFQWPQRHFCELVRSWNIQVRKYQTACGRTQEASFSCDLFFFHIQSQVPSEGYFYLFWFGLCSTVNLLVRVTYFAQTAIAFYCLAMESPRGTHTWPYSRPLVSCGQWGGDSFTLKSGHCSL